MSPLLLFKFHWSKIYLWSSKLLSTERICLKSITVSIYRGISKRKIMTRNYYLSFHACQEQQLSSLSIQNEVARLVSAHLTQDHFELYLLIAQEINILFFRRSFLLNQVKLKVIWLILIDWSIWLSAHLWIFDSALIKPAILLDLPAPSFLVMWLLYDK